MSTTDPCRSEMPGFAGPLLEWDWLGGALMHGALANSPDAGCTFGNEPSGRLDFHGTAPILELLRPGMSVMSGGENRADLLPLSGDPRDLPLGSEECLTEGRTLDGPKPSAR